MRKFLYILIITVAVFAVYANCLRNDFLSDDLPTIVNNPLISRPFGLLSIASFTNSLNYLIGGFNPFGYHLVNIILHAVNSVMVFFLLRRFFREAPSLWGALIFALHPVQVESVAWVSSRLYLLFTFFLLSSFFCYLRERVIFYIASLILYGCALLTSFFPLAFAPLIVLYDVTFGRWRRTWKLWPAFFLLAAIKLLLMFAFVQQRAVEIALDSGVKSWSNPFFNMVYSFWAHLWLLLWPVRLTIYHEPSVIPQWGLNLEIAGFVLAMLSLPILYKRAKPVFFGICLYILFLSPTYSPVMLAWLLAERYLYFASIGIIIPAAFLIDRCGCGSKINEIASLTAFARNDANVVIARSPTPSEARGRTTKQSKNRDCFAPAGLAMTLTVLVALYSLRVIIRNRDWRSHSAMWKATVKVSPLSPKAHINMGDVYSLEGNLEGAVREFKQAIELKPDYSEAYHNLATTYMKLGRNDEAALAYQQALKFKPGLYQSHANLGFLYFNSGQRELARRHLETAAQLAPEDTVVQELWRRAR